MARISVYYWAGAKAAAGIEMEAFEADSVAGALERAQAAHPSPQFARVLALSSVLIEGLVARPDDLQRTTVEDVRVEILPPFAGGADK